MTFPFTSVSIQDFGFMKRSDLVFDEMKPYFFSPFKTL